MKREEVLLYSVFLELRVQREFILPPTTGPQIHAMFLRLITHDEPTLFTQLHDVPGGRPFTLSQLLGAQVRSDQMVLVPERAYHMRVTLLDDGYLWDRLSTRFLEESPIEVRLDRASLTLTRMQVNPTTDVTGWVARTSWRKLAESPFRRTVSFCFASPTAFNMNGRYFALFPEPLLVWDSLIRVWNTYAPDTLKMEKQALRAFIQQNVTVMECSQLTTHTLRYQKYDQKGFTGVCDYQIDGDASLAQQITVLAEFARYAGVGYRTTWGMGQVRMLNEKREASFVDLLREVRVC